jgi:hypothetical protein
MRGHHGPALRMVPRMYRRAAHLGGAPCTADKGIHKGRKMEPARPRTRKRRIRRGIIFLLIALGAWQLVVFLIAATAQLLGVGHSRPELGGAAHVEALLNPSDAQVRAAWDVIHQALAGHDENLSSLGEEYAYLCREFAERGKRRNRLVSDMGDDFRSAPGRRFSWHDELIEYSLDAAGAGYFDDVVLAHLVQLATQPGKRADVWQSRIRSARLMGSITLNRYDEASALLAQLLRGTHQSAEQTAQQALQTVAEHPRDFQAHMALLDALRRVVFDDRVAQARAGLYRRAYACATNDCERAEAIIRMAAYRKYPRQGVSGEDMREAAAVVLAQCQAPAALQAENLAALGDAHARAASAADAAYARAMAGPACSANPARAAADASRTTALVFYRAVARKFPGVPCWGMCAFNEGYLLRQMGHPRAAIAALERIFPSNANERDPGGSIMEAYRNYRHRAATESSGAYADMYDSPRAFLWKHRSCTKYPYQTWCGTCRGSAERRLSRELFVASCQAGPLFMLGNQLFHARRYLKYWLALAAVALVLRALLRRFRSRNRPADVRLH